jgi:hypothetical protein
MIVIKPRGRKLVGYGAGLGDVRSAYKFPSESLKRMEYFGNLVFKTRMQGSYYSGVKLDGNFMTVSNRLCTS